MNRIIEIHDSTLGGMDADGPDLILQLTPAYVHSSEGRPGVDPGSGWLQNVAIVIRAATVETSPPRLPCSLSDGNLCSGETVWENSIPLPYSTVAQVSLRARTEYGESLVVHGLGAEVLPHGEPRYLEDFP